MGFITATTSNWFLIGPIATVLGYIMNWIFEGLNAIGLPNIGLAIIIFTLVIKALMIPLSIKQQKYSKLQSIMAPEVKRIQEKYKGKTDNSSVIEQQKETKELYEKYGTSPTGGCLQTLIQMPILFALYQVIYHLPGYISRLKQYYEGIADVLMKIQGWASSQELISLAQVSSVQKAAEKFAGTDARNYVIDMMYNFTHEKWEQFFTIFSNNRAVLEGAYNQVADKIDEVNYFLGIDLTMTPMQQIWPAIFIPILAGGLQWLSSKLMQDSMATSSGKNNDQQGSMMKTMNYMFPLMSVVFCFMFNCGIGLYWVASSGIQVIIQLIVNKYMNKVDLNEMVAKNIEKLNKKRAKKGLPPKKVTNVTNLMTSIDEMQRQEEERKQELAEQTKAASAYYEGKSTAKKGSLAEKAGMVQQYEERMKEMRGKGGKR